MADAYIWTPITLVGNLMLITIWTIFFNSVLTRRFSLSVTILCQAVCWFLSLYLPDQLPYASLLRYLSSILVYVVPILHLLFT